MCRRNKASSILSGAPAFSIVSMKGTGSMENAEMRSGYKKVFCAKESSHAPELSIAHFLEENKHTFCEGFQGERLQKSEVYQTIDKFILK